MTNKVSVVGLGKLGASMAACFASRGVTVLAHDKNSNTVEQINNGIAPVVETGLQEYLERYGSKISAYRTLEPLIENTNLTFIIVPTPSKNDGAFSTTILEDVLREIGELLGRKCTKHTIVVTSTIMPGESVNNLIPLIEKASGKKVDKDIGFVYSPEFISLGSIIKEFLSPEIVLIGSREENDRKLLSTFYEKICINQPPISCMNLSNAELTKLAINCFMTMKISFSNMLGGICETLPEGDVDEVTNAVHLYNGGLKKGFKSGIGYGGPCLPRDNLAMARLCNLSNIPNSLPTQIHQFNLSVINTLYETLNSIMEKHSKSLVIVGLAYKQESWLLECSQAFELANLFSRDGFDVSIYDPYVQHNVRNQNLHNWRFISSLKEIDASESTIFINYIDEAAKNDILSVAKKEKGLNIFDPNRTLYNANDGIAASYFAGGIEANRETKLN